MKLNKLFISHSSKDHLALNELLIDLEMLEKRHFFSQKLKYYNRVLSRVHNKLSDYNFFALPGTGGVTHDGPFSGLYYKMLEKQHLCDKLMRIENIINVLKLLSEDYNEATELFFQKLESEINPFLDEHDRLLEFRQLPPWLSPISIYEHPIIEKIKYVRGQVNFLKKKIYCHRLLRDMRRYIRSIIRFLYIKADDDAEPSNVFELIVPNTLFKFLNQHHAKKGNNISLI